jgi:hypothetical protein
VAGELSAQTAVDVRVLGPESDLRFLVAVVLLQRVSYRSDEGVYVVRLHRRSLVYAALIRMVETVLSSSDDMKTTNARFRGRPTQSFDTSHDDSFGRLHRRLGRSPCLVRQLDAHDTLSPWASTPSSASR